MRERGRGGVRHPGEKEGENKILTVEKWRKSTVEEK